MSVFLLRNFSLAGVVFGVFPILHSGAPLLVAALKPGGRVAGDGRERHRVRNMLVVSQVALAAVLLIGSGLIVRSFRALQEVQPGFVRPEEVLTLRVSIPSEEIEDDEAAARAHKAILERLAKISGVSSVGASSSITMDGWDSNDPIFVEEFPRANDHLPPIRRFKRIAGDYFATMGNPVLAGRSISWNDIENRRNVVVVTENFAREYWSDPREALSKRVRESPASPWREIVGIVGDIHDDGPSQEATPTVFWPCGAR